LKIFQKQKVAIGVVHCPPLPGTPRYRGESFAAIQEKALADAQAYVAGGIDGLIIENHGDVPFVKAESLGPETAAFMSVIADRVRQAMGVPIGINVLANAPLQALAIAKASGASFIRVNQWANAYVANEGLIEGQAGLALRYRASIGAEEVAIFADSHVKHGAHAIVADRSIVELTRDLEFFDADVAIATGQRTGDAVDLAELETIGRATALPVLVGSGVTGENVGAILARAAGVIIGSALKRDGVWWGPVEQERVARFMQIVDRCRNQPETKESP
jgi:membrane complex biogenesis BtpA family protein